MRKLVVSAVVATFILAGCAPGIPFNQRVQNFMATLGNIAGTGVAIFCSPTTEQVADAVEAIAFISGNPVVAGVVGGSVEIFKNIRDRICVSVPQLKEALARFDEGVKALAGTKAAVKAPDLSHLRIKAEE